MKIVLNDVNDVEDFLQMLSPAYVRLIQTASAGQTRLADNMDKSSDVAQLADTAHNLMAQTMGEHLGVSSARAASMLRGEGPTAESVTGTVTVSAEAARAAGLADGPEPEPGPGPGPGPEPVRSPAEAGQPAKDADGAPHNTDWHSDPAKINADGTWRARRKRDEAAYKDWLLSLAVETASAAIAADDAEPIATETHALPQDEVTHVALVDNPPDPACVVSDETTSTVDHAALIEASQEAAKDAPDGTIDLLNAGKEFIKEYGTAKFEALKGAVCPTEDGKGKAIPSMVPAERRLMRACMDNYALYL